MMTTERWWKEEKKKRRMKSFGFIAFFPSSFMRFFRLLSKNSSLCSSELPVPYANNHNWYEIFFKHFLCLFNRNHWNWVLRTIKWNNLLRLNVKDCVSSYLLQVFRGDFSSYYSKSLSELILQNALNCLSIRENGNDIFLVLFWWDGNEKLLMLHRLKRFVLLDAYRQSETKNA